MSLINDSMITKTPVIISLRNNHKIIARVKAFDRHCNMVLENVKELWTEKKGKSVINRERFVSKLFLRGDSVIVVLKPPLEQIPAYLFRNEKKNDNGEPIYKTMPDYRTIMKDKLLGKNIRYFSAINIKKSND